MLPQSYFSWTRNQFYDNNFSLKKLRARGREQRWNMRGREGGTSGIAPTDRLMFNASRYNGTYIEGSGIVREEF